MPQEKEFMIGPVQYTLRENGTAAVTGCLPIVTKVELRSLVHGAIVTEIGEKAFCQDHLLAEVVFPNTLQKIGKEAFCGCESLRKVELPDEISELEECCFGQCFQLRDVHFPKQLRVIGEYAFKDCISLGRIEIPAGCTEIAHNAFEECPSLTEFVVDDENDVYTSVDGILYTKDMSLLLRCPESRRLPVTLACGMEFAREAFDRCMWLPAIEVEEGHQRYSSIDGVLYNAEGDTLELLPQGRRKPLHLTAEIVGRGRSLLDRLLGRQSEGLMDDAIDELSDACKEMSDDKTGALIVVLGKDTLQDIIDTGDVIDASIRKRLIENIFFKNSPLHDGAMVIGHGRVIAARCTLPNTSRGDIPAHYGMRHKAALGLSERCDAKVIVVSEQTGKISIVYEGSIRTVGRNELKLFLKDEPNEDKG